MLTTTLRAIRENELCPSGWRKLLCGLGGDMIDQADARRIVACVNACAGIPTDALEAGVVGELLKAARTLIGNAVLWPDVEIDCSHAEQAPAKETDHA